LKEKLENFLKNNEDSLRKLTPLSWYGGVYRYLLDTKSIDKKALKEMKKKIQTCQRNDGGFQLEAEGALSSVIETAIAADFLLDIGESRKSEAITKALKFLLSQQREDGGFAETSSVRHPDDWDDKYIYEKKVSTPHITAWVLRALLKAGFSKENPAVKKALQYLANHQKKDGGWSHFKSEKKSCPYLTGLILIALGEFKEFRNTINIAALKKLYIDRQKKQRKHR
jgi:prenyltransferase beta subunit